MVKTLKNVTDDRVRAYIVWLPIFGGDFKGEARKLSNSFRDRRVSYFLDPESSTGKEWEGVLKTGRLIAWDVYILYGADADWGKEPPQPAYWMHQLSGVTSAPRFDKATFTTRLKGMLDELNAKSAGKSNSTAKVEFLFFKSCPGHKQALINLKAALQESGIKAHLVLTNVTTEAQAAKVGFQGSPSIRVNGRDLEGKDVGHYYGCRIYQIDKKITPTPTIEFIRERIRELGLVRR